VTEHPDALPVAPVPAEPSLLPDLRPEDASLRVRRALDASADVHLDAAADAACCLRALADVMCVEKLAALAPVVLAQAVMARWIQMLPAEVVGLYIRDAGRSAA
jgi:hypothetical protein